MIEEPRKFNTIDVPAYKYDQRKASQAQTIQASEPRLIFVRRVIKMSLISQLLGQEILDPFLSVVNQCPVLNTPTDWKETPKAHVLVSDLPGLKKEEVKVEVDDDRVLQINGERKVEEDNGDGEKKNDDGKCKWHRVERCRGKFLRRFKLPENAKTDEIQASMENGVLTVTVPKQEVPKPQRKAIEIESK